MTIHESCRRLALRVVLASLVIVYGASWLPTPWGTLAGAFAFSAMALVVGLRRIRWLDEAARVIARLADGDHSARVAESGPTDVRGVARAVNRAARAGAQRESDLNAALEDAARQRDRLHSIFSASSDGLLLYDAARQIVAANPRCGELLGFTASQFASLSAEALMVDLAARCADPQHYREQVDDHFRDPAALHSDVLVLNEPRRRVLKRFSAPVRRAERISGRVFTYTDVTAEWDIDQLKSEFVATASHELRTPLTSVHAALQVVLSGSADRLNDEDREMLDISISNTERLVRLVNDLLDLSKIEAGRMPVTLKSVRLVPLMEEIARSLQAVADTCRIGLHVSVADSDASITGDRDQLARVLTNLVSNALKYSPAGSTVELRARALADGVEVAVEDEGPGIPAHQVDRLFRAFSRVGAQERQTTGGTGLGLAISRAIVERHRGRIWWERNVPTGSRFVFVIPAVSVADPGAQPGAEDAAA